jgi:hypothetical protein
MSRGPFVKWLLGGARILLIQLERNAQFALKIEFHMRCIDAIPLTIFLSIAVAFVS